MSSGNISPRLPAPKACCPLRMLMSDTGQPGVPALPAVGMRTCPGSPPSVTCAWTCCARPSHPGLGREGYWSAGSAGARRPEEPHPGLRGGHWCLFHCVQPQSAADRRACQCPSCQAEMAEAVMGFLDQLTVQQVCKAALFQFRGFLRLSAQLGNADRSPPELCLQPPAPQPPSENTWK